MISVIITTHHGRLEFLKKALESVFNQTFKDFEVIVVDDASHDGTEKYIHDINAGPRYTDVLAKDKIIYVRRTKSFGNDTRPKNRGTRVAKGEYICYLDSDNQYRKDHLQILYNAITKTKADICYGDRMIIDMQNVVPTQVGVHSDFNSSLLMRRNYIDTSDVIIKRKSIFDVGGWDERYRKYVDWNLWVRMAKAGMKFVRAPYIITDYYFHADMKSVKVKTRGDNYEKNMFVPEWNPLELEIDLPYLHQVKEPKVAIYTLTKDRFYYTKTCFASLKDKSGYPYDHFICDNGSKDETVSWLEKEYKPHYLFKSPENLGISKGNNLLIKEILKGDYDIVIAVDNDCLLISEDIIKVIVGLFKKNKLICVSPYPEGLKDNPGGAPRSTYGNLNGQFIGITSHIGGFFKATSDIPFKEGFRWSEDVPKHAFQDIEFSQYLINHGYTLGYLENLKIEHMEGTTAQHERYPEYFKQRIKEKKEKPK